MAHGRCLNERPPKASRLHSDCQRGLSQVGCSAQKQGMDEQSSAFAVPPVVSGGLDLHHLHQSQDMLSCERKTVGAGSRCLAVLLCLYEAAAPAETGMTPSFFSFLYLDHWSQAMNQEKDILPRSKVSVYVTHKH